MTRTVVRRVAAAGLVAVLGVVGAPPAVACALTAGWEPWPPYQMDGGDGPRGMDIALLRAVAGEAGCAVTFRRMPWARLLKDIRHGQMDLALAAAKNDDRDAYAHFTRPYRAERVGLTVRAGEAGIRRLDSLKAMLEADKLVGVWRDYHYGERVARLREQARYARNFLVAPSGEKLIELLVNNRVDAVLGDRLADIRIARRMGVGDAVTTHPVTVLETPVRFMLSEASVSARARERLDAAIRRLRERGRLTAIHDRYAEN